MNEPYNEPDDERAARQPAFFTRWEVLAIWVVTFILLLTASQLVGALFTGHKEVLLVEVVVIIPALLYTLKKGYSLRAVFRLHPVPLQAIGYSILVGIGLVVLVNQVDVLLRAILPMPEWFRQFEDQVSGATQARSLYDWILLLFTVAFLGGFLEEMLFRGLILGSLEQAMDITRAVMVTALLFALMHLWPWMFIQILIIGIIVGVLAWKSNSIYPAVTVHVLNNALALVSMNTLPEEPASAESIGWYASPIWLIIATAALVYGMRRFYAVFDGEDEHTATIE